MNLMISILSLYDFLIGFPLIKPFIVAIWYGQGKPQPVNDFLLPFVNELNDVLRSGIRINDHLIEIRTRAFICDTPARSLLKCMYF